jgi:hypothetical protein
MGSTLKMSVRSAVKVAEGLDQLDGAKTDGKDGVVMFRFSPKISFNLSKNAVLFEREKIAFEKTQRRLAREAGVVLGEEITDKNRAAIFAFHEALEAAKDADTEISGVLCLRLADLLDQPVSEKKNPIPQSVLNKLVPIIQEDE